jgi:hypothetical protein
MEAHHVMEHGGQFVEQRGQMRGEPIASETADKAR